MAIDLDHDLKGSRRMLNVDDFESDEQRLLDSLADSLRRDFPNPARIGRLNVSGVMAEGTRSYAARSE